MRISVSPSPLGTIAIRFISAVQRQSGSSVEPASSRRSNFDMTPHPRWKAYVLSASVASEFNWIFAVSRRPGRSRRRNGSAWWPKAIAVGYVRLSLLMGWALFGACGCAAGDRPEAGLSKPTQVTCQAGPDCDAKWARANKWVTESSGLKIQSKGDSQIKTVVSQDTNSRTLVVTITKNATSKSGIYELKFVGGCPSELSCDPPIAESRARFVNFVLGTQ
jgi:hypothetical protein